MKKYMILFCLMAICTVSSSYASAIQWSTNYQDALKQSSSTGKPIVLFFTGSDWCPYCIKLDKEVLDTDEFAKLTGDKFIFVKIDDLMYSRQDPKVFASNKQLQQKYDINGLPAIVIIDGSENRIGSTGYRPGGPKAYASHLLEKVKK